LVKIVNFTDNNKPLDTLQACIDDLNIHGTIGKLQWSDGFAINLGVVVYSEIMNIENSSDIAFVYAIIGFDDVDFGRPGYHVHRIVNWSAEDPPFIFAVIDDMGRQLEFNLIEPSTDVVEAQDYSKWHDLFNADQQQKTKSLENIKNALKDMAQIWSKEI
jgi:hypothetical protein